VGFFTDVLSFFASGGAIKLRGTGKSIASIERFKSTTLAVRNTLSGTAAGKKARFEFERQGESMGFFSFIKGAIKGVVGIAKGFLGVAKPAAQAVTQFATRRPLVAAGIGAAALGTGALLLGGGGGTDAEGRPLGGGIINPATGEISALGGGNGMRTTVTQVITIDNATGQPVKVRTFMGAPFLMQKEVAHLKTSARKLMRGAARVPRRSAGAPSLNSEITRAVKHKVLHSVEQATAHALPA